MVTEQVVREYLVAEDRRGVIGILLYLLIKGVEDEAALTDFAQLARENNEFSFLFRFPRISAWPDKFQETITRLTMDLALQAKDSGEPYPYALSWFGRPSETQTAFSRLNDHPRYDELVAFLQEIAHTSTAQTHHRKEALYGLLIFEPTSVPRLIAEMVEQPVMLAALDNSSDEQFLRELQKRLDHFGTGIVIPLTFKRPQDWAEFRVP